MPLLPIGPILRIHYLDLNPGAHKIALLLHGLGATCQSWRLQFPSLMASGYRILAPDARGFGKSSFPGGGTSVQAMAEDMAALLRYEKVARADVIGISMGGAIALQLALDYPQLVNRLVLVNTFATLRPKRVGVWAYFLLRFIIIHATGLPFQARMVARRIFPQPQQAYLRQELLDEIMQADPNGYRAAMRALAWFSVSKRLSEIRAPALVISGERDTTVPLEDQRKLAAGISTAEHVVIPGAGHAVTAEKPLEFNRALMDYLARTGS